MTRTLTAVALASALLATACGGDDGPAASTSPAATTASKAARFADCMRDRGISRFPDPDANGELTIDAVANEARVDPSTPQFEAALRACRDLQPSGFTGPKQVSDEQQDARLRFADCIREHGVEDFPDPAKGQPLVDTRRIPSSNTEGGMARLNAAMQSCRSIGDEAIGRGK